MRNLSCVLALSLAFTTASALTITGTIYCDNYFEFYFNDQLVASDPLTFTPHNGVRVSFEWDEVSDKTYAIMCQDYASSSGYEYIDTSNPGLGDGALIAEFSDGTVTSANWKKYTATFGPTDDSITAGCSGSNLAACAVADNGTPTDWYKASFVEDGSWSSATVYTSAQAGWGRTPSWTGGECCQPTSPLDRSDLGCCNCNYDSDTGGEVTATVSEDECLDPEAELSSSEASFIWGSDLDRDNKVLFRYTATNEDCSTISVSEGTCTVCSDTTCTAVMCNANKFNTDDDATNGCEAGCPTVASGTCTTCSDASTCTAVTCDTDKYDANSDASDGCESNCADVAGGTCTACSDATTCTAVTCNANKFDTNNDASDGCEAGCPTVASGTCTACSDASTCTAVTCTAGYLDTDSDATNGCEAVDEMDASAPSLGLTAWTFLLMTVALIYRF